MEYEILCKPSYSVLKVNLSPGEKVEAEAGAMMMYEGNVEVKTRSRGFLRALAAGESLFTNTYIARSEATIWFAPTLPGDIAYIPLDGSKGIIVNDKAYLASHGDIKQKVIWRGFRGVFGGGGLLWLHLTGVGGVWVNAFGALVEREVDPSKELIIDNLHLVAMDDTLDYEIRKFGGLKSFLFGGEGFVFRVRGHGKLYLQTRNLAAWLVRSRG